MIKARRRRRRRAPRAALAEGGAAAAAEELQGLQNELARSAPPACRRRSAACNCALAGHGDGPRPEPVRDVRRARLYCYRVAGTVGLMMMPIMGTAEGYTYEEALEPALALGVALQLTNILRDVGELRARQDLPAAGGSPKVRRDRGAAQGDEDRGGRAAGQVANRCARDWCAPPSCTTSTRAVPPPPRAPRVAPPPCRPAALSASPGRRRRRPTPSCLTPTPSCLRTLNLKRSPLRLEDDVDAREAKQGAGGQPARRRPRASAPPRCAPPGATAAARAPPPPPPAAAARRRGAGSGLSAPTPSPHRLREAKILDGDRGEQLRQPDEGRVHDEGREARDEGGVAEQVQQLQERGWRPRWGQRLRGGRTQLQRGVTRRRQGDAWAARGRAGPRRTCGLCRYFLLFKQPCHTPDNTTIAIHSSFIHFGSRFWMRPGEATTEATRRCL